MILGRRKKNRDGERMTSTAIGKEAERVAAHYLQDHGYTIYECNWRTRRCEIDIIASRKDYVAFFEVKYRKSDTAGSGVEYVTPKKQAQMQFAAELWMSINRYDGTAVLGVIECSGLPPSVTTCLELG